MIDLNKTARECRRISEMREKNGGVGHDVLKHCAGEVLEAAEARKVLRMFVDSTSNDTKQGFMQSYASELADVIICALIAAADASLDIEAAVLRKMKQNEARALGIGDKK